MERSIKIGEKEVLFKCTAGTTARYQMTFPNENLFKLLEEASRAENTGDSTVFSKLAYVMAKQANPDMKENYLDWLDGFELMAFFESLPAIIELWGVNMQTQVKSKKKAGKQ